MNKFTQEVIDTVRSWWKRIRQSGHSERRREMLGALAWTGQAASGLEAEKGRVRQEFSAIDSAWFPEHVPDAERVPRTNYYHDLTARSCGTAAWCVTGLEALFAGGLAILLLTIAWWAGAILGVAVTILLAVGIKGVVAPLAFGRYADRPKAGRDLALRVLIVTSPIALALLAVIFVVRGVPGAFAEQLFPWATGGLTVLCPIIAAALFVLAGLYGWSRRLTDRYRALEQAERDVRELREYCERGLTEPAPATPTAGPTTTPAVAIGAMLLALSTMTGAACSNAVNASTTPEALKTVAVEAKESTASTTAKPSTGTEPGDAVPLAEVTGELWLDETTSVDELDRVQATHRVLDTLFPVAQHERVDRWAVYRFGETPWREVPMFETDVPRRLQPACDPPSEASRIFKVHQTDSKCADRMREAENDHHKQVAARIDEIKQRVRDHRPRPARCTSVGDLLLRISQARGRSLVVIISDGVETCRTAGLPQVPAPVDGARVLFVLVGSEESPVTTTSTPGEKYRVRRQSLLRAAPWLQVVAPWEITTGLLANAR